MTGPLAVVTSHSRTGLMPLAGLLPITDPSSSLHHQTPGVYLAWIEKEHLMSVTLICQLAGPFPCWHAATWKTARFLWRIKKDRWVRRERRSNTIMFFRYEYKMTQLTGHTRFYFISQCTRPPYFVFFVLFSSDRLHLILTARRHLEHFRFKMRVSILDLSLKCKTPAITNIARVSTYPLRHTRRHTHINTYTGNWGSSAMQKSNMEPTFLNGGLLERRSFHKPELSLQCIEDEQTLSYYTSAARSMCFEEHLRWEISNAVTESWSILDQRCLVWQLWSEFC